MPVFRNRAEMLAQLAKLKKVEPTAPKRVNLKRSQQILSTQALPKSTISLILSRRKINQARAIQLFKKFTPAQKVAIKQVYTHISAVYARGLRLHPYPNIEEFMQLEAARMYAERK